MKIENNKIYVDGQEIDLYSKDGFKLLSDLWVKVGWDQKYLYGFSWLGRPIIQLPEDMIRFQEVVWKIKPTLIIETGIAHGGSLILSASLLKLIGGDNRRVIGVDIDIRDHNYREIVKHPLASNIEMIQGSSIDEDIITKVTSRIKPDDVILIVLDSCHDYEHVLAELRLYSGLVTKGSYIVATDGLQKDLVDSPRAKREYPSSDGWVKNNPYEAILDFLKETSDYVIEEPEFPFNEGEIDFRITHWPSAYIRRVF
jgi:cephalosporin hydroxylase